MNKKTAILSGVCWLLILLLLASCVAIPSVNPSMPTPAIEAGTLYRGNLGRTGEYTNGGTPLQANSQVLWKYADWIALRPPVIGNGLVFVSEYGRNNRIDALDSKTGKRLFSLSTRGAIFYSTPTFDNGILYYATPTGLQAYDVVRREALWSYKTENNILSPIVFDHTVYVGVGNEYGNGSPGNILALDSTTGSLKWQKPYDDKISSDLAIENNILYFNSSTYLGIVDVIMEQPTLRAVDRSNGKELWNFAPPGTHDPEYPLKMSEPTVAKEMVFTITGGVYEQPTNIYALNATTGKVIWKITDSRHVDPQPVVFYKDWIYLTMGQFMHNSSSIIAVDAKTGEQKWVFTSKGHMQIPAISDDVLYVATGDYGEVATFFALDPRTGQIRWEMKLGYGRPNQAPVIADGILYQNFHEGLVALGCCSSVTPAATP